MKPIQEKSLIPLANSLTAMSTVCGLIGMPDPNYASSGAKVDCPFRTFFHPEGQKSFRVYDDKSAYCFACGERWSPVDLYSQAKDIPVETAAEELLEAIGYRPLSPDERFQAAMENEQKVDQSSLEEALKLYCEREFPDWDTDQFEDDVARRFRQCVELLPAVHTTEDAKKWLTATKEAMSRILDRKAVT